MDLPSFKKAASAGRIEWRRHAYQRMVERGSSRETVVDALLTGDLVEDYPDAAPYPAVLLVSKYEPPIHVVASFDAISNVAFVITVYEPDLVHFLPGFRQRRQP